MSLHRKARPQPADMWLRASTLVLAAAAVEAEHSIYLATMTTHQKLYTSQLFWMLRLVLVLDGKKPALLLAFNNLTCAADGGATRFECFSTIQVALKPLRPLTPALHAHSLCADVKKRERAELFDHVIVPY